MNHAPWLERLVSVQSNTAVALIRNGHAGRFSGPESRVVVALMLCKSSPERAAAVNHAVGEEHFTARGGRTRRRGFSSESRAGRRVNIPVHAVESHSPRVGH